MAITPDIIAKLKDENPGVEISVLENPNLPEDTQVLARAPTEQEWRMLKATGADPGTAANVDRQTVNLSNINLLKG